MEMTYNVLLSSLIAQLRKSKQFPEQKMYVEAQPQALVRPCFFVEQVSLTQDKQMFNRYRRVYTLRLTWLPALKSRTQDADCRATGEQLLNVLRLIQLPDLPVRPTDMEYTVVTGTASKELQFSMQVVVHVYSEDDAEKMGTLDLHVFEESTQIEL